MKRLILVAVIAFIGISASAQIVQSTMLNIKKENKTTWFVRAGMSINNAAGDATKEVKDDGASVGSKFGYDVSVGFQRRIGSSGLYWGEELGFGTRGAKMSYKDEEGEENSSLLAHNVKFLPFVLGYKYGITDDIKLDAHLGGFASYDIAGTGSTEWKDGYDDGEKADSSLGELDEDEGYQRFDAGIHVGIGVWYKRYNLDLSYQKGFISVSDYFNNKSVCSSNLMIRLGISF
ncbi:MAG: outer membrane beta-barrel protein [Muribaculaceae bacterium]